MPFLKSILLALSLAIDVFAISVGIGVRQSDIRTRARFAAAFVSAELAMLLLGSVIGHFVFELIGPAAGYVGFVALILVGAYVIYETMQKEEAHLDLSSGFGLILSALAISFDSLGIGFSILFIGVPFWPTVAAIGICTLFATILGFAVGKRLGTAVEERAEFASGALLILTGVIFMALKATGHGG